MAFDTKTYRKRMTVAKLAELLGTLPQHLLVECNAVANLLVTNSEDCMEAYIDFNSESVEWEDPARDE